MKVTLNIDKIVLNGFDKSSTLHVEKIIQRELTRLIVTRGFPEGMSLQSHDLDSVDGGRMNIPTGQTNSRVLGSGIARSIYNSIVNTK